MGTKALQVHVLKKNKELIEHFSSKFSLSRKFECTSLEACLMNISCGFHV